MKKPAFVGRASSVACNPILAPSCLVVDAAMAHLHLDLLHKKDEETRLRAITYKGGGLSTIKGNFTDLSKFSEFRSIIKLSFKEIKFKNKSNERYC